MLVFALFMIILTHIIMKCLRTKTTIFPFPPACLFPLSFILFISSTYYSFPCLNIKFSYSSSINNLSIDISRVHLFNSIYI